MKKVLLFLFVGMLCNVVNAQKITGPELLEKAIQYHDPNGNWEKFNAVLAITMVAPKKDPRYSSIHINLPDQYFKSIAKQGENTTEYTVFRNSCLMSYNGKSTLTEEEKKKYNMSCERAKMYKNYYTYLYGLPMKLKDPGTNIDPKVQRKKFKGKEYLVLKATYDKEVGDDTWYFYFDPKTYAMEVYQFFHDESKNDGEYILLKSMKEVLGIKMPKIRGWYYNKDDKYLGTDVLK